MKYNISSKNWAEGLPIGNGRLAAMAWQDGDYDVLTLNHEWLWRGANRGRKPEKSGEYLPLVRKFLSEGDYFTATALTDLFFSGRGGCSGLPIRNDAYQVAGELRFLPKGECKFIERELDVRSAVAKTDRMVNGIVLTSTYVASCVNDIFLFRWQCIGSVFDGELSFSRTADKDAVYSTEIKGGKIIFNCGFNGGISYRVVSAIETDGELKEKECSVCVENATYLNVICDIGTEIKGIDNELLDKKICFDDELEAHNKKFSGIMGRVEFDIEGGETAAYTNELVDNMKIWGLGNEMVKRYFDFGRYLLISSSFGGDLPANLQGKWNDSICPPWESDYHMDVNLQMNYWFAESCNLPECAEKLVNFVKSFERSGQEAARKLYNCGGVYLPLMTDAWGISTPEAFGWAACLCAAPWLAQHLWWRYIYSGNIDYLKDTAYPYFKLVVEFYEDYLVKDDCGVLQIMPSQSPENRFTGTGRPFPVSVGISSALDVQLVYDALGYAIKSCEILGIDSDKRQRWTAMQDCLPEFKIGPDGRLLEWNEEKEEVEPGHRHFSHLYGLYPSELFTREKRPLQYDACKKALEFRLRQGAAETGWGNAWAACMFARFGDGKAVISHLFRLVNNFTTASMLDMCPLGPGQPNVFQVDGNLGFVAAVVETIVRFTDGKIHLLNAVPDEWKSGYLKGIKIPGGHTVNVSWHNGKLTECEIEFGFENQVAVVVDGICKSLSGKPGEITCILSNKSYNPSLAI